MAPRPSWPSTVYLPNVWLMVCPLDYAATSVYASLRYRTHNLHRHCHIRRSAHCFGASAAYPLSSQSALNPVPRYNALAFAKPICFSISTAGLTFGHRSHGQHPQYTTTSRVRGSAVVCPPPPSAGPDQPRSAPVRHTPILVGACCGTTRWVRP